jgi:hypothetical protein
LTDRQARTLLEQRIRQRCMTYEEFVQHAETFARDNHEPGTLSLRHLQRLAGGQHLGALRPATARLLEHLFSEPIATLLAPPNTSTAGGVEDPTAELHRELLRLLSMVGVLVMTPSADEQLDQVDGPFITSGRFDNVAVGDYAALNEHLWRVFVLSQSKGPYSRLCAISLACSYLASTDRKEFRHIGICVHWPVNYCNWRVRSTLTLTSTVTQRTVILWRRPPPARKLTRLIYGRAR